MVVDVNGVEAPVGDVEADIDAVDEVDADVHFQFGLDIGIEADAVVSSSGYGSKLDIVHADVVADAAVGGVVAVVVEMVASVLVVFDSGI